MFLYLHGFRSIGMCYKGRIIFSSLPNSILPDLPYVPKLAINLAENIIKNNNIKCIIGSSLGGYYATFLAEKYKIKSVLINPVINAYKTLLPAIGTIPISYNKQHFFWSLDLVESLKDYKTNNINYELYLLLLQKGDNILDYKEAQERFKDSKTIIEDGGSHRFENFQSKIEIIRSFANS
ncbi:MULTISPECIES: YqiA/YcfP family alpha/beta fold hydrolase [Helicobacter]|uniref:Esterase n=1 Tax=Helicobacter ibis TaxID=2962633 RepID=A0ABT4VBU3_9HELI|nr:MULTISPECIES: YqiA/YcfP family alpha/beta fold hydrolase [Helicobacter]MDA3966948.1 hypothetical protein [Helicobacter sp. WB40]MDA3968174.1 hypothetical protein [Helicobacter ibis]